MQKKLLFLCGLLVSVSGVKVKNHAEADAETDQNVMDVLKVFHKVHDRMPEGFQLNPKIFVANMRSIHIPWEDLEIKVPASIRAVTKRATGVELKGDTNALQVITCVCPVFMHAYMAIKEGSYTAQTHVDKCKAANLDRPWHDDPTMTDDATGERCDAVGALDKIDYDELNEDLTKIFGESVPRSLNQAAKFRTLAVCASANYYSRNKDYDNLMVKWLAPVLACVGSGGTSTTSCAVVTQMLMAYGEKNDANLIPASLNKIILGGPIVSKK